MDCMWENFVPLCIAGNSAHRRTYRHLTKVAEVARLLKTGGIVIVSFTNRFFYEKALRGWIERGMKERARLVQDYLRAAGGYEAIEIVGDGTSVWAQLASVGGIGGDPFVAVVAQRAAE